MYIAPRTYKVEAGERGERKWGAKNIREYKSRGSEKGEREGTGWQERTEGKARDVKHKKAQPKKAVIR